MLTIDFTRCSNMELDQSESYRSGLKGQHVFFLDIGQVDIYPEVDIHPAVDIYLAVDILSTHQYEMRCMMEDALDGTQTSSCYEVSHSQTYLHHKL